MSDASTIQTPGAKPSLPTRRQAVWFAGCYAVLSSAWVGGSGWLLHRWVHDPSWAGFLEDVKGWGFVVVTALLLGWVLGRNFLRIRQAVQRIADSEARLHLVSDNLPESYLYQYTLRPDGRPQFSYVSAGVQRVHGVTPEEVLRDATCLFGQFEPEGVANWAATEPTSAQQLGDFAREFRIRRPDGQVRFLSLRSRLTQNEQGQLVWEGFATDNTHRKRAEQALKEREELLAEMGRLARIGGWELDPATGQGQWTDEVARIHDLEPTAKPNREMGLAFYQGESRTRIQAAVQAAIEQGTPYDLELELLSAKGVRKWVRTIGYPVIENGRVSRLRGALQDITERKTADTALRQSEERFALLFHASPSAKGISRLDDGRFLDVNDAFVRLYGYRREEIIGHTAEELHLWHSENRAQVVQELREKKHLRGVEMRGRRKDGEVRELLGSIELLELEGVPCMVGTLMDITELKRAEAALRASEAKWRSYIEKAPVGVLVADEHGRHLEANRCIEEMFGYPPGGLLGTHIADLHPPEKGAAVLQRLQTLAPGEETGGQMEMRRKDGGAVWVLVKATKLEGNRLIGFFQNITELKQAEEALRTSERNYREIFNATNEAIFLHDAATGEVLDVNDAMLRLYGYDLKEEVVSGSFQKLLSEPPYDLEAAGRRLRLAIEEGPQVFEWLARKRNGDRFWVEVSLRSSQLGAAGRVLAVARDITKRREAEQALREREQQLQLFFQHSPAAVAMLDRNLCYLAASQRWHRDYRLGERDLLGRSHYEIFPEVPERWKAIHRRCLAGAIEKCEAEAFLRADGSTTWLRWEVCPWRTAQGEIGGIIVFSEDITEHKQAEAALRSQEEDFRAMFEVASIGLAQANPQTGQWMRVNRKMCEITGYTEAEMRQLRVPELTHPEDRAHDWNLFGKVVRGEEPDYHLEKRYVRKDGGVAWVSVHVAVVRDAEGRPIRTMAAIEDITARKQTEEVLRLRSAALEAAANAIFITDRAGIIEWANPALCTLTGYTSAEIIGQNPRLLNSGRQEPGFFEELWHTILEGKTWRKEMVNRRKDGSLYEEEMTITPLRDARGVIAHFIAIKQDITERKQLQSQLQQAQKMEAVGRLAGGVAHDFNNLLAVIMMQAELTASEPNATAAVKEGLEQIRAAAERAGNLTRQLLLFSRKQVMQPRDLDLNEVVTHISKMLRRVIGEDVQLQLHLHSGALMTHADAGMLDQVLMNLAVNARDAMPEGGRLLLETSEKVLEKAAGRFSPDAAPGKYVCLSVSDSGCGIPPEVLPRIFEPFFTTKEVGKGTGLGLATVFGIVKQHRGWVEVDSQPGQGTCFRILLPASAAPKVAQSVSAATQSRGGSETILLAEDDAAIRSIARRLLERLGYQVLEAADGLEAMGVWQKHRDVVALLVTDLVMPGGLTGQQLARKLQADKPGLKVIYTSGYSPEIAGQGIELRPGENFIQKPYAPHQLLDSVRRFLDLHP